MLPVAQTILRNLGQPITLFEESPTATAVVEATPIPVPVVPTPAPAAVISPWAPSEWLKVTGWVGNYHGVFLAIFLVVAVAAVVTYFYLAQRVFKNHSLHARLAERVSLGLTIYATVGVIFLFFAMARTPLLGLPVWLILSLIALIAGIVYSVYYYRSAYPVELAKYLREQERARYLPKVRGKGPAKTPPMRRNQPAKAAPGKKKGK